MNPIEELQKKLETAEEKLGYAFENKDLLILALTHRSFVNEHRELAGRHNERLEFLGDSVLGLAVADYLYHRLPSHPEGQLSQLRSRLVDAASCAQYLQKLDLSHFILLGKGEEAQRREDEGFDLVRRLRRRSWARFISMEGSGLSNHSSFAISRRSLKKRSAARRAITKRSCKTILKRSIKKRLLIKS